MAEETKPKEEKPQIMPWQENWELKPNQVVSDVGAVVNRVTDGFKAGKMPWELNWKEKPRQVPKAAPVAPQAPSSAPIDSYIDKVIGVESGGDPNAKNPNSSATGLGQFTNATWRDAVKEAGKKYTLADRTDPKIAREILTSFTLKNAEKARKELGREPTHQDLYFYHLLGRYGAGEFLTAPKDKPATEFVTKAAAKANPNIFYKDEKPRTVGEVKNLFKGKF